jgi:hypothetical protein
MHMERQKRLAPSALSRNMRPKHGSGRKSERYVASFPRVVHSRHDANATRSARRVLALAISDRASLTLGFAGPTAVRPAFGFAAGAVPWGMTERRHCD